MINLTLYRKRIDYRDRRDRTELTTKHWEAQLDMLVSAYLTFQMRQGADGLVANPVVDDDRYPNEALVRNGFLGCSPLHPTVCISFRTLSAYRQIHRTCPRYSLQAFAKSLCYLHNGPFDVYLQICRRVDEKINKVLDYDSSNRLARQCPACFFHPPDENEKGIGPFSVLVSMDGNNSLKRIRSTARGHKELPDSREVVSDRWLSAAQVDKFSNEVRSTAVSTLSFTLVHKLISNPN
ncbi:hypothetical protein F5887DRAFT_896606 [Amanita rubescens]|nr:hypothetical protein F5887DRAFT_896606 [Amanita rubescens]